MPRWLYLLEALGGLQFACNGKPGTSLINGHQLDVKAKYGIYGCKLDANPTETRDSQRKSLYFKEQPNPKNLILTNLTDPNP
jgi:hypothetical protein